MISEVSSKLVFASCLWFSGRMHYWVCVLIKNVGRRLPSEHIKGQFGGLKPGTHATGKVHFFFLNTTPRLRSSIPFLTALLNPKTRFCKLEYQPDEKINGLGIRKAHVAKQD